MEYSSLTLGDFLSRFQFLCPQVNRVALNQRQATISIPIICRPQPRLLLTQRSVHLHKHAGQAAFPGGTVDSSDAPLVVATLREVQEEMAVPPSCVEIIGVLPPVDSVTGLQITPVADIIPPNLPHRAGGDGVPAAFEMPLVQILHLDRYRLSNTYRHGDLHRIQLS